MNMKRDYNKSIERNYPCAQGGILRLAWLMSAKDVQATKRLAYTEHVRTCDACRKYYAELDAIGEATDWRKQFVESGQ